MFRLPRFLSLQRKSPVAPRRRRLTVEQLESRQVLSYTFSGGLLIIHADADKSNDSVKIVAAGAASDGSTVVQVRSNLVNQNKPTNIGGLGSPVLGVTLDLRNGNDKVSIESLPQVKVLVGEGNGNNDIRVGDASAIGVIAGNGHNHVELGAGSSLNVFGIVPGNGVLPANTVAILGWKYSVTPAGGITTDLAPIGNNRSANDVKIRDAAGKIAIVDIAGSGSNSVDTGDGDDIVWIQGSGNNHIKVHKGINQVQVDGNGNNDVDSQGVGSITINGQGNNDIKAGPNPGNAVLLTFTNQGGHNQVKATAGANVQVNGVQITLSGKVANTKTTVKFEPGNGSGSGGSGSGAA
jgi:hypothetical protein